MPLDFRNRKLWSLLGLYVAPWTLVALISALGAYVSEWGMIQPVPWGPLLRQQFKEWYAYGILSVGVLWFCGRNRLEPGHVGRWVMRHFGAALIYAALYAVLTSWWVSGERSVMHEGLILSFWYLMKNLCVHYLLTSMLMYWFLTFGHLGWHYYQRFREREVQAAELQRQLVEARLEALRMQLNPHFLFNTLHAISALVHENPDAADRVIARLSELLRMSLDQSQPQEVALSKEMAFLDRYLEIEKTRFGERLTIQKQIEPEAKEALVPYLILQPLVENAIRHGIEQREDNGRLEIAAWRKDRRLELRISDNGPGLPETGASRPAGIGLANTRSRLSHLYGSDYRLDLKDGASGGLEACIDIPYHTVPRQA